MHEGSECWCRAKRRLKYTSATSSVTKWRAERQKEFAGAQRRGADRKEDILVDQMDRIKIKEYGGSIGI